MPSYPFAICPQKLVLKGRGCIESGIPLPIIHDLDDCAEARSAGPSPNVLHIEEPHSYSTLDGEAQAQSTSLASHLG